MKIRFSTNAAAIVAVFIALYAFEASGQQTSSVVPPGLPTWIPTFATSDQMNEWLVTNQPCYVSITVHYTTNAAGHNAIQNIATPGIYASYGEYVNYVATNTVRGISGITNADWTKPAWMYIAVYNDPNSQAPDSIDIWSTNSTLSGMTSQWVSNNLVPSVVHVNVSVPNLQQLDIQVQTIHTGTTNFYSYHTNLSTQKGLMNVIPNIIPPPYPPERTTTGWLALNPWYLFQTNRARFIVTTSTANQEYTQMGAVMISQQLTMLGSLIQASVAAGSDVTLLSSDDLSQPISGWQTNSVSQWSLNTNLLKWSIDLTSNNKFFAIKLN